MCKIAKIKSELHTLKLVKAENVILYIINLLRFLFIGSGNFMVVTCNSFGVSGMDGYKVELEASMT